MPKLREELRKRSEEGHPARGSRASPSKKDSQRRRTRALPVHASVRSCGDARTISRKTLEQPPTPQRSADTRLQAPGDRNPKDTLGLLLLSRRRERKNRTIQLVPWSSVCFKRLPSSAFPSPE
ncbi:hypothetical protein MTO96_008253 [Rhipicephalus appendiculatus]